MICRLGLLTLMLGITACQSDGSLPFQSPSSSSSPTSSSPSSGPAAAPLGWRDIAAMPLPEAGKRLPYGKGPLQFGELRVPAGKGPHPVALIIHGGCWLSAFNYQHITNLSANLTKAGLATWTIEYRRVGDSRGGWPGTFLDVAAAADHLRTLSAQYPLDLKRVVAVGHSAGGQLALWLAARRRLDPDSELHAANPLPLAGVVSLAGITDLKMYSVGADNSCNASVKPLLGGTPEEKPHRYAQVSPLELLPLGVPLRLIHGARDSLVPPSMARAFADQAKAQGDEVKIEILDDAGHFELVAPQSTAWPVVRDAVLELVDLK